MCVFMCACGMHIHTQLAKPKTTQLYYNLLGCPGSTLLHIHTNSSALYKTRVESLAWPCIILISSQEYIQTKLCQYNITL